MDERDGTRVLSTIELGSRVICSGVRWLSYISASCSATLGRTLPSMLVDSLGLFASTLAVSFQNHDPQAVRRQLARDRD